MSFTNINIGENARDYRISKAFNSYGRIDAILGEDEEGNVITVSYPNIPDSNVSGRIMTIDMPMCTDTAVARNAVKRIYNNLTSKNPTAFQYQPQQTLDALIDPSIEFGDSIDVNKVHSGFHTRKVTFGRLMLHDISSPVDEEIDHEYHFEDSKQRQITRTSKELKAGLYVTSQEIAAEVSRASQSEGQLSSRITVNANSITSEVSRARTAEGNLSTRITQNATDITARVTKTGGNNSSFAWSLQNNNFSLIAGSKTVFQCTASGVEVDGKITARSGYIGNGSSGFEITNTAISNGVLSMSDASHDGVYVGTDGIRLGKGVFSVSRAGKVDASNLNITGGSISIKSGDTTTFSVSNAGRVDATNLNITGGSILIKNGDTETFSVSTAGQIKAISGSIGGFTLSDTNLYSGNKKSLSAWSDGVYIGSDGISLGSGEKFKVTNDGKLTATDASIKGSISATGGSIGGFTLTSNSLYSGSKSTLDANASGVYIGSDGISLGYQNYFKVSSDGSMTARSGEIGGFSLTASGFYKDKSSYYAEGNGIYIGTSGIALGNNFKVDTSGNVNARNMTLSGTLTVGGSNISAESLYRGASEAANNYSSWNNTSSTVYSNSGTWSTGAGYGYDYNNATWGSSYPSYFYVGSLHNQNRSFEVGGTTVSWQSMTVKNGLNHSVTIYYLGHS